MGCTTRSVALPCERHANSRGRMATRLVIFDERRDSKGRVRSTGRLQNGSWSCKMADGVQMKHKPDLIARIAKIALDMHLDLPKILGG